MWVIPVIAVLIVAAVVLNRFLTRDTGQPLERHERALAALRDLAEKPRPVVRDFAPPPIMPPEHIRILADAPEDAAKRRPRNRRPAAAARSRRTATTAAGHSAPSRPRPVELPAIPIAAVAEAAGTPAQEPEEPAVSPPPHLPALPVPSPERWAEPRRTARVRPSRRVVSAVGIGVAVAATAAGAVLIATNGHGGTKVASSRPPARVSLVPSTAAATPTTPPTTAASLVGQVVPTPTGDASVAVHGPFTLSLHATGRCWVQVVGGTGQTLFEGTLNPGQTQSVSGAPPLTVRLGNTRGITLLVDGSNLDLAGVANTANVQFQLG